MTRAHDRYSKVLIREFYIEYKGELHRLYPQGQLWKSGDPISSFVIRGVRVDIFPILLIDFYVDQSIWIQSTQGR